MNPDRVIAVRTQKTVYKDGDSCVKVFGADYSAADVLSEALCLARAAEAGIRVPEVRAVETAGKKRVIVTEYIAGRSLSEEMKNNPGKEREYLAFLARLQLEIHEKPGGGLPGLSEKIARGVVKAKEYGANDCALFALLKALPEKKNFCHGDFNPSNVISAEDGEAVLLDFSHAAAGDPLIDAAVTYLYFEVKNAHGAAETYLEAYVNKSGEESVKAEIKKRLPLAAALLILRANEEERERLLPVVKSI